ncbi:MAG: bifunctional nuclease family protein [Candidatus Binataceae bacterium]|nr:bifunctional nuclease family protein [Candidatus Binataceae bacterium]
MPIKTICGWLAIFSLMLGGCIGRPGASRAISQVKVEVGRIGVDNRTGTHYVLLRDKHGRSLPIMIGESEARAIVLAMHGVKLRRPLMDQLLSSIIEKTGNHLDRAVISEIRGGTYYAYITLDDDQYQVDCRPSDAIALAMNTDAPIYVNEQLFQHPGASDLTTVQLPATIQKFGLTMQQMTPQLAGYFNGSDSSGLLITDAAGVGAAAGLSRGDVVVSIDGDAVNTLEGFSAAAARVGANAPVTIVARHDGTARAITFRAPPLSG